MDQTLIDKISSAIYVKHPDLEVLNQRLQKKQMINFYSYSSKTKKPLQEWTSLRLFE